MSEDKKNILAQIEDLPPEDKAFIIGYAAGVAAKTEPKKEEQKETA